MITLKKTHPTHAIVQYGNLILRGSVIRVGGQWVTLKIDGVKGMDTGAIYDHHLTGRHLSFAKIDCDLYR